jgi:hypothetical protein
MAEAAAGLRCVRAELRRLDAESGQS